MDITLVKLINTQHRRLFGNKNSQLHTDSYYMSMEVVFV